MDFILMLIDLRKKKIKSYLPPKKKEELRAFRNKREGISHLFLNYQMLTKKSTFTLLNSSLIF
jgi:hypothetical protein